MRGIAAASVAALAVVVTAGSGATTSSSTSGIVFDGVLECAKSSCTGRIYNDAIYVVSPFGGSRKQLTSRFFSSSRPAWSPDRRLIAFSRRNPEVGRGYDIYVMRGIGGSVRRVTHSGNVATEPGWSPDGRRVVYRANTPDGQNFDLYVVNANGSGRRRITSNPDSTGSSQPAWSPDGSRIAFARSYQDHALGTGIYTIGPAGKRLKRVAIGGVDPAWSPDGRWIAFSRDSGGGWHVYVVNANGSRPRRLAEGLDPSWSPDGTRIAFVRSDSIAVMNTAGGDIRIVAKKPRKLFVFENPDW